MLSVDYSTVVQNAYREATIKPVSEIAQTLQGLLSRRLTAYIVGVKDGKTISRWATGETTDIREDSEIKLRTAYELVKLITNFDSEQVARAWMIGLNPQLDDSSPAEMIHEGRLKEVRAAARAFIVGG